MLQVEQLWHPSVPFLGARDPCLCAQSPSCPETTELHLQQWGHCCQLSCYCPLSRERAAGQGGQALQGTSCLRRGPGAPWGQEDRPSLLILWVFCRLQAGGVGRGFVGLWLRAGTAASPGLCRPPTGWKVPGCPGARKVPASWAGHVRGWAGGRGWGHLLAMKATGLGTQVPPRLLQQEPHFALSRHLCPRAPQNWGGLGKCLHCS